MTQKILIQQAMHKHICICACYMSARKIRNTHFPLQQDVSCTQVKHYTDCRNRPYFILKSEYCTIYRQLLYCQLSTHTVITKEVYKSFSKAYKLYVREGLIATVHFPKMSVHTTTTDHQTFYRIQ